MKYLISISILSQCLLEGVALTVPAFHPEDELFRTPSLRLNVNSKLESSDLLKCVSVLEKAVQSTLNPQ